MNLNVKNRTLFCHDNLEVLQGMNSESVDLIYMDPPFNKKKEFNSIFETDEGTKKGGFRDKFRKEDVKDEWLESIKQDYDGLYQYLTGVRNISNIVSDRKNKHYLYNYCYLVYMAMRLLELQRILKNTGSIYLHCDPTMSHYLKILMDIIFGEKNFRNEIVWHYSKGHYPKKDFRKKHDIIFRYSKSDNYIFNPQKYKHLESQLHRFNLLDEEGKKYRINHTKDKKGDYKRFYLEDGVRVDDNWTFLREKQFDQLPHNSKERTGWKTQKPRPLLERIIKASSKEGDVVLDPFCGCATTCIASELLGRKWIGIDISPVAYYLIQKRAKEEIPSDLFKIRDVITTTKPPIRTDLGKDYRLKKYVYIISNPAFEGLYKVGIASNLKSRLNSYQTGDPERKYTLEFSILTPYFQEIEKAAHEKFNYALEWVRGNLQEMIDFIKNYKK